MNLVAIAQVFDKANSRVQGATLLAHYDQPKQSVECCKRHNQGVYCQLHDPKQRQKCNKELLSTGINLA